MLSDSGAKHLSLWDISWDKNVSWRRGFCTLPSESWIAWALAKLEPVVAALKQQGIAEERLVVYGFDECHSNYNASVYAVFGAVKRRWPKIKTMSALDWETMPADIPLGPPQISPRASA